MPSLIEAGAHPMPHRGKRIGLAVLVFLASQIIAPIIPGVDFLPQQYTTEPKVFTEQVEFLFTPENLPNAHEPFGADGYYVQMSQEIPKGTDVRGNVTFYYQRGIEASFRNFYVLTAENYTNADYASINRRSVYVLSNPTPCCNNYTDNTVGYVANFTFHASMTSPYAFLCRARFALRVAVNLMKGKMVEADWVQPIRIVGWLLEVVSGVYAVLAYFKKDEKFR